MININPQIVAQLEKVLPTHYELFLDAHESVPCISYQIISNSEVAKGNINGYSSISVRVKIWAVSLEELDDYSSQIDDSLAEIGHFNRNSVAELTDGDLICWIFDYSILVPEQYTTTRI